MAANCDDHTKISFILLQMHSLQKKPNDNTVLVIDT